MGALADRFHVIVRSFAERVRHGLPDAVGPLDREVIFILDGVGGFQFAPLMLRRVLRQLDLPVGTIVYKWQFGFPGEIWTDLMWLRRNRVMAARLARKLLAFRRARPDAKIHLLGYSGGAGVAVMGCAFLRSRPVIDTMILAAPALSPEYNLAPALRSVRRCVALVSERDRMLLGLGTRIFGTIDRRHCRAAGMVGFRVPADASAADRAAYDRLQQIRWSPALRADGPSGGHIGWLSERFISQLVAGLVRDEAGLELACWNGP